MIFDLTLINQNLDNYLKRSDINIVDLISNDIKNTISVSDNSRKKKDLTNIIEILNKIDKQNRNNIMFFIENDLVNFVIIEFFIPLIYKPISPEEISLINHISNLIIHSSQFEPILQEIKNNDNLNLSNIQNFNLLLQNFKQLNENKILNLFISNMVQNNTKKILDIKTTKDFLSNLDLISKQNFQYLDKFDTKLLEDVILKYNNKFYFLLEFLVKKPQKISKRFWITMMHQYEFKKDFLKLIKSCYKKNSQVFLDFFDPIDYYDATYLFFNEGYIEIINKESLYQFINTIVQKNNEAKMYFLLGSKNYDDMDDYLLQLPIIHEVKDQRIYTKLKNSRFFQKGEYYVHGLIKISHQKIIIDNFYLDQLLENIHNVKIDFNQIFIHRNFYKLGLFWSQNNLYILYSIPNKFDVICYNKVLFLKTKDFIFQKDDQNIYMITKQDSKGYLKTSITLDYINKKLKDYNIRFDNQSMEYTHIEKNVSQKIQNENKIISIIDPNSYTIRTTDGMFNFKSSEVSLTINNTIYSGTSLKQGRYTTTIPSTINWHAINMKKVENKKIMKKTHIIEHKNKNAIYFKTNNISCIYDIDASITNLKTVDLQHNFKQNKIATNDYITSYYFKYKNKEYNIVFENINGKVFILILGKKTHWKLLSISFILDNSITSINTKTLNIYSQDNSGIFYKTYDRKLKEFTSINKSNTYILFNEFDKFIVVKQDEEYNFIIEKGLNRQIIFKVDNGNFTIVDY